MFWWWAVARYGCLHFETPTLKGYTEKSCRTNKRIN